jgi:glycosyltransferase involved in cell wall biosynthesis
MKILICTHRYIEPFIGGVDVYTNRLRRAFIRLGHEVIVLAFDSYCDQCGMAIDTETDEFDATRVIRIKFSFSNRPTENHDLAYDPELGSVAESVFKQEKPEMVVVMNFYTISLSVVQAAKNLNIPVAHIATDFLPICRRATLIRGDGVPCQTGESLKACSSCFVSHRLLGKIGSKALGLISAERISEWTKNYNSSNNYSPLRFMRPYFKQVAIMQKRLDLLKPLKELIDVVFAPTRYTTEMFRKNGFSKPGQLHYLPFAVEPIQTEQNRKFVSTDHIRFLFIGRLQPYKGVHLLVNAFANLARPQGATLTIFGSSDGHEAYFAGVEKKIRSHSRIKFVGAIANDELSDPFSKADYFVLPSTWHENSPLILLDALRFATPVIASDIGGVRDHIIDGVNGLLFPNGDQRALQKSLQSVIDHPHLREKLTPKTTLPLIDDYAKQIIELCLQQNALIS